MAHYCPDRMIKPCAHGMPKSAFRSMLLQLLFTVPCIGEAYTVYSRFAFNGSFTVHLFIGHIKKDQPERFMTKKNEVGYSYIFASARDAPCANCITQREQNFIYEDAIPITTALTQYLSSYTDEDGPDPSMRTLQSFEPEHVIPFLKEHLNWVVTDGASTLLDDPTALRNSQLEISVWDRLYDMPTEDMRLGKYHPATLHSEVTEGRLGGYTAA